MGIRLDLQGQPPLMRLRFVPGFDDIYIVHKDLDINALRLQASEVDAARWVTRAEALEMVRNRTFLPYIESFIASLFDMRKTNGFMRDDD